MRKSLSLFLLLSFLLGISSCNNDGPQVTSSQDKGWTASFRVEAGSLTEEQLSQAGWVSAVATRNGSEVARAEANFTERSVDIHIPSAGDVQLTLTGHVSKTDRTVVWSGTGTLTDGNTTPGKNLVALALSPSYGTEWDTTYSIPVVQLTANNIVISSPLSLYSYCSGSTLYYDTAKAGLDSLFYDLHGDTLWVGFVDIVETISSSVAAISSSSDSSVLTASSSGATVSTAKVIFYEQYTRSSGSGVTGIWNAIFRDTVVPLNIPETDSTLNAYRTSRKRYNAAKAAAGAALTIEISSSILILHIKDGNWAMLQMENWDEYNASHYAVKARLIDANTITFTVGDTVVTKTRLDRNRVQVSSNVPVKYPTYIDYERPTNASQCVDNWFWTFLGSHYSSKVSGRVASAPSRGLQGRLLIGLLTPTP